MKFDIWGLFENLSGKFKFNYNVVIITGTLHEDLCTFMTACRWILLRMRNGLDKVVMKIKTHILSSIIFFPENRAVYEMKWKKKFKMRCRIYTPTVVWRTCDNVTLYVDPHCLSCVSLIRVPSFPVTVQSRLCLHSLDTLRHHMYRINNSQTVEDKRVCNCRSVNNVWTL
jgi:hypothetical protein